MRPYRIMRFLRHLPIALSVAWEKSEDTSDKPLSCMLGKHKWIREGYLHMHPNPHETPWICGCCYTYRSDYFRTPQKKEA